MVRVLAQIRQLAAQGMGVIFSSHDPDHALAYVDRVALLAQGRLLAYGVPSEVVTPANLQTLYGIDVRIEYLAHLRQSVCVALNEAIA